MFVKKNKKNYKTKAKNVQSVVLIQYSPTKNKIFRLVILAFL